MNPITQFSKTNEICAVAIGKTNESNTHCGILYNSEDLNIKNSFFLHLGNPLHLYNETENDENNYQGYNSSSSNFLWLPFNDVPISLLRLIRTKCRVIAKKNNALPYGIFHDENTYFDAIGNLILGQDSSGLTCATFVKVVLKGSGLNIIDEKEWPDDRVSDLDWLKGMVEYYKEEISKFHNNIRTISNNINKSNNTVEITFLKLEKTKLLTKVDKLNNVIMDFRDGTKSFFRRYRPEEVSACSYQSFHNFPIKFKYTIDSSQKGAEYFGEQLLQLLPVPVKSST